MSANTAFNLSWAVQIPQTVCDHENAEGSKFCSECGLSLEGRSPDARIQSYLESHIESEWWPIDKLGGSTCDASWYNRGAHLGMLSIEFPAILFELAVSTGTEDGYSLEYYLNGQFQEVIGQVTYPDFNISRLTSVPEELL